MDEWVGEMWHIHTVKYYSAKGNESCHYSNLDGAGEHYVKGNKLGTKRQGLPYQWELKNGFHGSR